MEIRGLLPADGAILSRWAPASQLERRSGRLAPIIADGSLWIPDWL